MLDLIIHLTRARSTLAYLQSRLFHALVYSFSGGGISGGEIAREKDSDCSTAGHGAGDGGGAVRAERNVRDAERADDGLERIQFASFAAPSQAQQEHTS